MTKFSIAIPCKNRSRTVLHTLRTCLNQSFDDYEIVLFDNNSKDNIISIVSELNNDKIKYLRSNKDLCMSDSWEEAVKSCSGQYIMLVGNNDGMLFHCLNVLDNIISVSKYKIIRWNRLYYTWPDPYFTDAANRFEFLLGGSSWLLDSRKTMNEVVNMRMDYTMLPMFYTAAIHRSLIDELIERTGRIFKGVGSDTYSGFAFSALVEKYLSIGLPMTINGCTDDSLGYRSGSFGDSDLQVMQEINLNKCGGFDIHKGIPIIPGEIACGMADSFLIAKDNLFPYEYYPSLEYERLIIRLLRLSGSNTEFVKNRIEDAIYNDRKLYDWFMYNFKNSKYDDIINNPIVIADQERANKTRNPSFDGKRFTGNGCDFGISNIYDVAEYYSKHYGTEYERLFKNQLELS